MLRLVCCGVKDNSWVWVGADDSLLGIAYMYRGIGWYILPFDTMVAL